MFLSEKEHEESFVLGKRYGESLYFGISLTNVCANCYMQGVALSALRLFISQMRDESEVEEYLEKFLNAVKKSRAEALLSSQPERTIN